jgi:hypothetical protein
MHIRLAVLAAIACGASYGCATPAEEPAAKAPAAAAADSAPQPRQGSYRTGSRLPSYEYDKSGSSTVGESSKDDYADDMRRGVNPTNMR